MTHEFVDNTPGPRSAATSIFCNMTVLTAHAGHKLDWEALRPDEYYKARALDNDGNEIVYRDLVDDASKFQTVDEWQISKIAWRGQGTPIIIKRHLFFGLDKWAEIISPAEDSTTGPTSLSAVEKDSSTGRRPMDLGDYDELYELLESVRGLELTPKSGFRLWGQMLLDERMWEREF